MRAAPLGNAVFAMQVAGFDVEKTDERLTLRPSIGLGQVMTGCLVLGSIFACVLALGILGVVEESQLTSAASMPGAHGGWEPRGNHFAFLWVIACVVGVVLIPVAIAIVYRGGPLYVFDRPAREMRRDKTVVTRWGRIEYVSVRRITPAEATDERPLYHLVVLHSDGQACVLKESHQNETLEVLASEIAGFVDREMIRETLRPGAPNPR